LFKIVVSNLFNSLNDYGHSTNSFKDWYRSKLGVVRHNDIDYNLLNMHFKTYAIEPECILNGLP